MSGEFLRARFWTRGTTLAVGVLLLLGRADPALAHPHIWVDATAEIVFNEAGEFAAVRHSWRFDEAYSAWAVQGLDTDGNGALSEAELQPLADDNMVGLAEYGFFTFGDVDGTEIGFGAPADPRMRFEEGVLTLSFEIAASPAAKVGGELELEVGDPEYYAAFSFEGSDAVALAGAPAGCATEINPPRAIDPEIEQELFELPADVTVLPPHLRQAARDLANSVVVACGGATGARPDATPQAQTNQQPAIPRGTPFTAPPVEPGAQPTGGGFLGWVAGQQQRFYRALTDALGSLKTEGRAFWALGLLSFLYGIFHAAGPGHGKVVISSYLVARERDIGRGIGLSFAAAMMQSLTAVVFVGLAAGVLRLTSFAMSDAAAAMTTGSYVLIAAIGAWLVWRKLAQLRGGGAHGHSHAAASGHAHADPFVAPQSARGDWREMVSVVVAVGLRPCSGALIVLAFALTQGLLLAGVFATFLMGVGTALTVTVLAGFAVTFKDIALRMAKGGRGWIAGLVGWAELAAALLVFGFGVVLTLASL